MRTTIDIPDEIYRKLKVKAAVEDQTVREIAVRAIQREIEKTPAPPVKRLTEPILKSYAPGSIRIDDEQIAEMNGHEADEPSGRTPRKRFEIPVIKSSRPGSLKIDNETIYDLIEFP